MLRAGDNWVVERNGLTLVEAQNEATFCAIGGVLPPRLPTRKSERTAAPRWWARIGKALMVGSVLLVVVVELVNSAIEATVDRISLENHQLAKRAKDIGSAAVFVSLVNVAVIWALILTA